MITYDYLSIEHDNVNGLCLREGQRRYGVMTCLFYARTAHTEAVCALYREVLRRSGHDLLL